MKVMLIKLGVVIIGIGTTLILWWFASPVYNGAEYSANVRFFTLGVCVIYSIMALSFMFQSFHLWDGKATTNQK